MTPSTHYSAPAILALALLLSSVFCLSALAYAKRWLRSKSWKRRRTSRNTEETCMHLEETSLYSSDYRLLPIIDRDAIKLDRKIGQGAFGEVFSADWCGSPTGRVAIKMYHFEMDAEMGKEAHLLSQLEHPNIVRLFGIVRERQRILLVLELISLGDLKSYVRARIPLCASYSQFPPALTNDELLNICIQICHGLCYLNTQQIVHRDLAARNCLVSGESDARLCDAQQRPPFTVKISDFGMSRRLYAQSEYYRMHSSKTVLPVRWLAPECIQSGKFTHSSDIWAFGVTIWEVYTYGEVPFGELSNGEVVSAVSNGVLLTKPKNAPEDLFQIMEDCWKIDPEKRPLCHDVLTRLTLCQ
ncbi:Insulin-like growth factor 1 receptor [Toxocara canis]|uniref:receptor protein-tyrosine kinase n=1 Tax=Toxocara canis TaxID=6265 RepID=A0A0B2V157_TOXCA|nr:Insulin-like growth factor 1 receptor [Toxocara canis]